MAKEKRKTSTTSSEVVTIVERSFNFAVKQCKKTGIENYLALIASPILQILLWVAFILAVGIGIFIATSAGVLQKSLELPSIPLLIGGIIFLLLGLVTFFLTYFVDVTIHLGVIKHILKPTTIIKDILSSLSISKKPALILTTIALVELFALGISLLPIAGTLFLKHANLNFLFSVTGLSTLLVIAVIGIFLLLDLIGMFLFQFFFIEYLEDASVISAAKRSINLVLSNLVPVLTFDAILILAIVVITVLFELISPILQLFLQLFIGVLGRLGAIMGLGILLTAAILRALVMTAVTLFFGFYMKIGLWRQLKGKA